MNNNQILRRCEKTGKTRYATPGDAKKAILKIKSKVNDYESVTRKRLKRRHGKADQCRYYACRDCHGYHLTSMPAAPKIKTLKKEQKLYQKNTKGLVVSQLEATDWKADSIPFPTQTNEQ